MKLIKNTTVFVIMVMFLAGTVPAMAEVIVIANKDVPINSLSRTILMDIFLGKKVFWSKDMKIVLTMIKSGVTHGNFLGKYVDKTPSQFNSYWNKKLFTGTGTPPTSFKTEKELVDYVARTRGAIGYIDSNTPHENTKAIKIR